MKLISFKIENFKSIVNTGWVDLSKDDISCLIGQNESGKSSVLEALNSFWSPKLDEDFLRNDMSIPAVSFLFNFDKDELSKMVSPFSKSDGYALLLDILNKMDNKISIKVYGEDGSDGFDLWDYPQELETLLNSQVGVSKELLESSSTQEQAVLRVKHKLTWRSFTDELSKFLPRFVLFNDEFNLLPNEIDIEDLSDASKAEGKQAVLNLLLVADIDVDKLSKGSDRSIKQYMSQRNRSITAQFQEFWTQRIGNGSKIEIEIELRNRNSSSSNAGEQYLQFWVRDNEHTLHPKQRSKGVRWFLSFYLSLKADSLRKQGAKSVFLIDEPGASLHPRAQEDVLKVFEEIKKTNQIIFTTHSQHLIEFNNLHRLLAVQRRNDDENSDTIIIPAYQLGSASTNTLAPILEHMGVDFSNQNVISKTNNIILEEISALYYFQAFSRLFDLADFNYLPATGVTNVEQLALLFIGWGLKFSIIFDDDSAGRSAYQSILKNVYVGNEEEARKNIYRIKKCSGIEDLFSKDDFANLILKKEVQKSMSDKNNSDVAKLLKISKPIVALEFLLNVQKEEITIDSLDDDTKANISELVDNVKRLIDNQNAGN
jgi:AAA15 family ATPase/GTPase